MKIILLILVGGYLFVCLLAFLYQSRLMFFPDPDVQGAPGDIGLDFRELFLVNDAGKRIHGWFVPAPDARYTLLFCHGNAGNISQRLDSIRLFHELGLSVFIFDYSGYGKSEGRPSEKATYLDSRAAWDYLVGELEIDPGDIILFGRSLGGAVAIELATEVGSRKQLRGLIVESCFTSAVELGARVYPWLPVRFLARIRYDSMSRIREVDVPKLFIHSIEDEIVPFGMGRRLYNRARRPKTFVKIRGGHNDGFMVSNAKYRDALAGFIDALETNNSGGGDRREQNNESG